MIGMSEQCHDFETPVVQSKEGADSHIVQSRFLCPVEGSQPVIVIPFFPEG